MVVAVAGDVKRPGLVRLAAGSRVDDAVRAAGGLAPGAEVGLLNLARRLVDGEQVVVGGAAPVAGAGTGAGAAAAGGAAGALVDLNTATSADLDGLPGIGPVLAERIVDYRTAHGPFRSVDQLREVSGIGESKYQSLRDAVTV
ncbi:MAG: DNA-binding protein [Frankiales bacterium]|nr:DNA-binding protein [Frankiales bacterium]